VSSEVANLHRFARTLDQELAALLRGASLECLVCGEFVMHAQAGVVFCPECGAQIGPEAAVAARWEAELDARAG
jgi:uncharacterized Zn finger protein (UPF0148 family)